MRGYLILGSTGEFPHLTEDEKLAVETVRGAISPEKLLLVGTGELSTRQTLEMTRRAHELGADGGVVVTPFYYKKVSTRSTWEHVTRGSPTIRRSRSSFT